ncbi:MAG: endonuclease/exonuclease/phosphatase family metal-dependent hydrolase [Planctomycetota bacterium]
MPFRNLIRGIRVRRDHLLIHFDTVRNDATLDSFDVRTETFLVFQLTSIGNLMINSAPRSAPNQGPIYLPLMHALSRRIARGLSNLLMVLCLFLSLSCGSHPTILELPAEHSIPDDVDLAGSFSFRMCVRMTGAPSDLPMLASNKAWESGEVRDYTTNNAYGLGRESGVLGGFAISVLPDGAWTWNAGDGKSRLDHRPESADQGIADDRWHEIGFAVDRAMGVVHLFHDGRRVALHDLQGVGSLASNMGVVQLGHVEGCAIADVRMEEGVVSSVDVSAAFTKRFGEERRPPADRVWDGQPLKVLAWNIWHGGRRKGIDEGVQRVVEVIERSGADIVLMQETYGSGPRISGRLGFDYYLRSSNLSVMSRYPIRDVHRLFSGFHFGGVTIELDPDVEVGAYSLWIHYLPSVDKELKDGASAEKLIAADEKTRGRQAKSILAELFAHLDKSPAMPVIVGGDFNSGSHLDWTKAAAQLPNHHGRVVEWPVSVKMEEARFEDTFRVAHVDPVAEPGHTWSPEFTKSHQDRIDYVYVRAGDWRVVDSEVLATHPRGWPSDHAAVLSTLELEKPTRPIKVMSYNIHYGIGMDKKRDLARIAAVIASADPDVVGLQEIGSKAMADELARLTGMPAIFGPSKSSDKAYGDAILCKHPFKWVGNLSLPTASTSRYQAMAIDVDLSSVYGEGSSVRVINTHFDWTDSLGSKKARRDSVKVIEQEFCADFHGPAILTGDLNAIPGSPPLLDLGEVGWHLTQLGQPMETHGAPNPTKQIDYLLVRPRVAWNILGAKVMNQPVASDHHPVVLTVRPIW